MNTELMSKEDGCGVLYFRNLIDPFTVKINNSYKTTVNHFNLYLNQLMRFWHFSSSVNSSSNAHAQPSSWATSLIFGLTLHLLPYFMWANSEGFGATARMRRLAWAFAGCLCDKYHNRMGWLIWLLFKILLVPLKDLDNVFNQTHRNACLT